MMMVCLDKAKENGTCDSRDGNDGCFSCVEKIDCRRLFNSILYFLFPLYITIKKELVTD